VNVRLQLVKAYQENSVCSSSQFKNSRDYKFFSIINKVSALFTIDVFTMAGFENEIEYNKKKSSNF